MQGSGTFAIESVISSVLPRDGKLLVLINGAYGHRMAKIARTLGIATETLVFPESRPVDPAEARQALAARSELSPTSERSTARPPPGS